MSGGIPEHEPLFQISVVARMVGVHQQTLRTYERMGLVQPARTQGNRRLYSSRDVERVRRVLELIEHLGVNLAGVDVVLRMNRQIDELQRQLDQALSELETTRQELARVRAGRRLSETDEQPEA